MCPDFCKPSARPLTQRGRSSLPVAAPSPLTTAQPTRTNAESRKIPSSRISSVGRNARSRPPNAAATPPKPARPTASFSKKCERTHPISHGSAAQRTGRSAAARLQRRITTEERTGKTVALASRRAVRCSLLGGDSGWCQNDEAASSVELLTRAAPILLAPHEDCDGSG